MDKDGGTSERGVSERRKTGEGEGGGYLEYGRGIRGGRKEGMRGDEGDKVGGDDGGNAVNKVRGEEKRRTEEKQT